VLTTSTPGGGKSHGKRGWGSIAEEKMGLGKKKGEITGRRKQGDKASTQRLSDDGLHRPSDWMSARPSRFKKLVDKHHRHTKKKGAMNSSGKIDDVRCDRGLRGSPFITWTRLKKRTEKKELGGVRGKDSRVTVRRP